MTVPPVPTGAPPSTAAVADLSPQDIWAAAVDIAGRPPGGGGGPGADKEAACRAAHPAFAARYPLLFAQCVAPGFRPDHLRFMIDQMTAMAARRATGQEATAAVMRHMNGAYVDPLLARVPPGAANGGIRAVVNYANEAGEPK